MAPVLDSPGRSAAAMRRNSLDAFALSSQMARAWVGAVPAAVVIAGEIMIAVGFLGAQYERIDVSDDLRVTEA